MKIADGVYVHFIPTQKYKTNRIVFRMTGSLNKQTIAKRALVSQMLTTANQTYPTVQSFKERLASLYGTQLSTKVSTKGLTHSVDIELTYLKDFFIPMNTSLFWEVLGFLMDGPSFCGRSVEMRRLQEAKNETQLLWNSLFIPS